MLGNIWARIAESIINCFLWPTLTFTDKGNVVPDEDDEDKNADGDGTSDIGEQTMNDGK